MSKNFNVNKIDYSKEYSFKIKSLLKIGFKFKFMFVYNGDTIIYKTVREFDDTDDLMDCIENYAENFVKEHEKKFGDCIFCDVLYKTVPMITYYFLNGSIEIKIER